MMAFLTNLLALLKQVIPFDRVEILLMDHSQKVFFREPPHPASSRNDQLLFKIIERALWQKSPVMIDGLRDHPSFQRSSPADVQKKVSVVCVPLLVGEKASGALVLERKDGFDPFSDKNVELLLSFLKPINKILETSFDLQKIKGVSPEDSGSPLVGQSPDFRRIIALVDKVKDRDASVIICGESGTGKELVARAIHQRGARQKGQFVAVNCGAIPELLLESELFGYVKGAFTGAMRDRAGLIEEANGGTFFLDEICDLSPHLQAKLLRLLQEREIRRIGENRTRRVNVRFISATNKDIEEQVKRGKFREDLYYRLKVITIELPPLRQRKEDLLFLLNHYIDKYCIEMKRERAYFSPCAMEWLLNYDWPGNVRELQSEIQRCLILSGDDALIREDSLSSKINPQRKSRGTSPYDFAHAKAEFEKRFLNQALARWSYNRSKTARAIGMSRQGLFKLIKKHDIKSPKIK